MPAKSSSVYWGQDKEFANRLSKHNKSWQAVYDENRYNHHVSVDVSAGKKLQNYPLEIMASPNQTLAEFTFPRGGIGHLPVILRDAPPLAKLRAQRFKDGKWKDIENVSTTKHDYYQGYLNNKGKMDYVFSLKRPNHNLTQPWKIRIVNDLH